MKKIMLFSMLIISLLLFFYCDSDGDYDIPDSFLYIASGSRTTSENL